jgi:hypothetical protein
MNYIIESKCPECRVISEITVTEEGYNKRLNGAKVQDAFPELTPPIREQLISGICPDCWNSIFGKAEDDDN